MKIKNIWLMALAMIATTSCTNEDEGIDSMQVPLNISAVISNSAATRATVTEISLFPDGAQIGVFGEYNDVTGYTTTKPTNKPYTYSSENTSWSSNDPFYYQNKETVTFSAYYPYDSKNYKDAVVEAQDFLYASGAEGSVTNNNVTFNFNHVMSKIKVTFLKGDGVTDEEIKAISNFHIKGLYTKGTFDTSSGTATGTSEIDYIEGDASYTTNDDGPIAIGSAIVFPQDNSDKPFTFIVKIQNVNYQSQEITTSLVGNTIYSYTITVNKTGLKIAYTEEGDGIVGWNEIEKTVDEDGNEDDTEKSDDNKSEDDKSDDNKEDTSGSDDSSTVTVTVSATAKLYSLALSDGQFVDLSDGNDGLNTDYASIISKLSSMLTSGQEVMGVVYYLGDTGIEGKVGTSQKAYSNGLIVALNDVDNTYSSSGSSTTYKWQDSKVSAGVTTHDATKVLGYSNTQALETYNETASDPCLPVKALTDNTWNRTDGDTYSGWFIPSVFELVELYKVVGNVNNIVTELKGTKLATTSSNYRYWTSTEDSSNKAYYVELNKGSNSAFDKSKTYYVRAICAF